MRIVKEFLVGSLLGIVLCIIVVSLISWRWSLAIMLGLCFVIILILSFSKDKRNNIKKRNPKTKIVRVYKDVKVKLNLLHKLLIKNKNIVRNPN